MWQKHAVVFGAWATTVQLYLSRNTFEYDRQQLCNCISVGIHLNMIKGT